MDDDKRFQSERYRIRKLVLRYSARIQHSQEKHLKLNNHDSTIVLLGIEDYALRLPGTKM